MTELMKGTLTIYEARNGTVSQAGCGWDSQPIAFSQRDRDINNQTTGMLTICTQWQIDIPCTAIRKRFAASSW